MTNEQNKEYSYKDFLQDDQFVRWRLTRTEESDEYWINFEEKHPECRKALNEAIEKFNSVTLNDYPLSDFRANSLLVRIRKNTTLRKRRNKRLLIFTLSAACIAALTVSILFSYFHNPNEITDDSNAVSITGKTLNEENIQFISSGKSLSLSQDVEIKLTEEGRASVQGRDGEEIDNLDLSLQQFNKLIVPYGKRSSITLVDGTKIWLNSGTELEFPSRFAGKTRNINVSGEIYIDVAEDRDKPFYIHTSKFDIRVLGTKFNVSVYDDDAVNSIVLAEGKVKVNTPTTSLDLKPREMLTLAGDNIEKTTVNVGEYISWKEGVLHFDKATLSEILNKVARYYNLSFNKSDHITFAQKTYSGKLVLSDNPDDVMKSISAFSATIYERNNNLIQIRKK